MHVDDVRPESDVNGAGYACSIGGQDKTTFRMSAVKTVEIAT
jgi:hypothetical protein